MDEVAFAEKEEAFQWETAEGETDRERKKKPAEKSQEGN